MNFLFHLLVRLVLLAAGLAFAASLAVVLALVAALWGARSVWARLTGRPAQPFVMRVDPFAGFERMARRAANPQAEPARAARREIGDVTDVEAKPPRAG